MAATFFEKGYLSFIDISQEVVGKYHQIFNNNSTPNNIYTWALIPRLSIGSSENLILAAPFTTESPIASILSTTLLQYWRTPRPTGSFISSAQPTRPPPSPTEPKSSSNSWSLLQSMFKPQTTGGTLLNTSKYEFFDLGRWPEHFQGSQLGIPRRRVYSL